MSDKTPMPDEAQPDPLELRRKPKPPNRPSPNTTRKIK
jgi:hypothetical protein